MTTGRPEGILLVGHGTRDPDGAEQFLSTARAVCAALPERLIEACFLEILEPDLAEGCKRLVERGARQVAVLPLLLLAAGHAKRDIPTILERLRLGHPGVAIHQRCHVGSREPVVRLSIERYQQAIAGRAPVAAENTLLLLVARGTTDAEAIREMRQFARQRAARSPVGRVEVCFAAVAEPSLEAALEQSRTLPFARVVVQPHLLFGGLVMAGIKNSVESFAQRWGGEREWLLAQPLGPDPALVQAIVNTLRGVQPETVNVLSGSSVEQ